MHTKIKKNIKKHKYYCNYNIARLSHSVHSISSEIFKAKTSCFYRFFPFIKCKYFWYTMHRFIDISFISFSFIAWHIWYLTFGSEFKIKSWYSEQYLTTHHELWGPVAFHALKKCYNTYFICSIWGKMVEYLKTSCTNLINKQRKPRARQRVTEHCSCLFNSVLLQQ